MYPHPADEGPEAKEQAQGHTAWGARGAPRAPAPTPGPANHV